jgi:hypothetical protein
MAVTCSLITLFAAQPLTVSTQETTMSMYATLEEAQQSFTYY